MNCLICLKTIAKPGKTNPHYHAKCLEHMFGDRRPRLDLAESRGDLVTSMPRKTEGFSISGVQMKAQVELADRELRLVDNGGQFIMKPSPEEYPHVAENEHATLTLMARLGFPVPPCGLIELKDKHLVFLIRRYDREFSTGEKRHQEDAMQALGISNADSSQKYIAASYQEVIELIIDRAGMAVGIELLERIAFSYLVGNDDHHLKNISFVHDGLVKLAPCYDVLASSLYTNNAAESPMALRMLRQGEPEAYAQMGTGFYYGADFLELGTKAGLRARAVTSRLMALGRRVSDIAPEVIQASFMPEEMKSLYQALVDQRLKFFEVMQDF